MVAANAMDVLAPPLIWVEGGCYRFYENHTWPSKDLEIPITSVHDSKLWKFNDLDDEPSSEDSDVSMGRGPCYQETPAADIDVIPLETHGYEQETSANDDIFPVESDKCKQKTSANIDVIPIGKNKFQHTFHIDKVFFPCIVGPKRSTLLQLQFDTDTSIEIPRPDARCSNVVIIGSRRETVVSARHQLELLIKKFKDDSVDTNVIPVEEDTLKKSSANMDIIAIGKDLYEHTFEVDRSLLPRIVGNKGDTLNKVRSDTKTSIEVPRRNDKCSNIVITGFKREAVASARHALDLLINRFKRYPARSHVSPVKRDVYEQNTSAKIDVIPIKRDAHEQDTSENIDVIRVERDAHEQETSANIDVIPIERDAHEQETSANIDVIPIERDAHEQETSANIDVIPIERDAHEQETSANIDVIPIERDAHEQDTSVNINVNPVERDAHEQETSANIDVVSVGKNKYQHTFNIDRRLLPHLVGRKASIISELQFNTETSIDVPPRNSNRSNRSEVVITGSTREKVVTARHQVDLLLKNANPRDAYTHFLSIPLTDKTIMANYSQFKTVVLTKTGKNSRGVRKELFRKPEKLHLCIGMLELANDEEINAAIRTLQECNEQIIKPLIQKKGPVIMKAKGLYVMVPTADTMVNSLHCSISSKNDLLQELADKTLDFFVVKGLIKKPSESLRVRMAVMNVAFNTDSRKDRLAKFHPKNILKHHWSHCFGEIPLTSIHLSKRWSYGPDGYYATVSKISLVE